MGSKPLLEIEKEHGRFVGFTRSDQATKRGARQVYEMRGGKPRAEIQKEVARYRKYGLTGVDVAVLLLKQGGTCVGCGAAFGTEIDFVIDHDHETGKVRGLLCAKCNIALPHWMTSTKLRRLAKYLDNA